MKIQNAKRRVLFVDDDHSLILSDLGRLSNLNVEIDLFKDANTAFTAYLANPLCYDLVVIDLMLEGMWGDEFAARVREINPNQHVVIWTEELGPLAIVPRLDSKTYKVQSRPREIYSFLKNSLEGMSLNQASEFNSSLEATD